MVRVKKRETDTEEKSRPIKREKKKNENFKNVKGNIYERTITKKVLLEV